MASEQLIGWAAGIFEGEGCIQFDKNTGAIYLRISLTDKDVLEKFLSVVKVGNLTGPYHNAAMPSHYKDKWIWGTGKYSDVCHVLQLFWPLLCERRREKVVEVKVLYWTYPKRALSIEKSLVKGV